MTKKEYKKNSRIFNSKRYRRSYSKYSTKEEAEKGRKLNKEKFNMILDKNKEGYFFWMKSKK